MRWTRVLLACTLLFAAWPHAAAAQNAAAPAQAPADDPDKDPNRAQPDFTLIGLPTTLRVPRFSSAFRVTHRFLRPLGAGDFGDLAEDLFGIDSGAQIGLEYRFGLMRGLQVGLHRTSDKTIEFFTQYSLLQQRNSGFGLDVVASMDGTNNFKDRYTPAIGIAVSRELGNFGAVYVDDTFVIGLGARVAIRPTVYLVGEFLPRVGYDAGVNHASFAIEKRAGGHVFQLNFSNGFGTTLGQLARGGTSSDDWYMGFNISRKFFR
jgi:hypothetical protein